MKLIKFLIIILILLNTNELFCQTTYKIGDKLQVNDNETTFYKTKIISEPFVDIVEKKYSLKINKNELIDYLELISKDTTFDDELYKKALITSINYLKTEKELVFKNFWKNYDRLDDYGFNNLDNLDEKQITNKILVEEICSFIENGNFLIMKKDKIISNYFFKRVNSKYGNVKGVFSDENILIWICPPYIFPGTPKF